MDLGCGYDEERSELHCVCNEFTDGFWFHQRVLRGAWGAGLAEHSDLLEDVRNDARRTDAGYADAERCKIESEGFRYAYDRVLARHVGQPVETIGKQAGRRRGVNKVAAALSDEVRKKDQIAPGNAEYVEIEDSLPCFDWH